MLTVHYAYGGLVLSRTLKDEFGRTLTCDIGRCAVDVIRTKTPAGLKLRKLEGASVQFGGGPTCMALHIQDRNDFNWSNDFHDSPRMTCLNLKAVNQASGWILSR
ncbi:hypothetical protein ALQ56_03549 [Pseudomonas syringae pv. papulans]|uniref:Cu/Ag efflux pump CusA n=1 Tax=Pseudomonas syringae pv. actinidiae TaxID=103796 RepID=A0AAN4QDB9_PSESF|nr:hypothetical protein ALQ56_03549 [Pseudomonas syringae pv. papulans]GBH21409.1 Cu/Ag efflux pump CusA [Pseudomonas syringae pv. actinidiae]